MRALLVCAALCPVMFAAQPVNFRAADGVTVYGEYSPAANSKSIILLFHQAGSSHAEYNPIVPELVKMGFNCLAIDQRSGGNMYGPNRTAAHVHDNPSYMDAYKDMQAAFAWAEARGFGGNIIAWGSSYSSSLVLLLAAAHPEDVKAVLSFSPGEYLDGVNVQQAASKVTCPVFIDTAKDPKEIASAKPIFEALPSQNKTMFEPGTAGNHGSSTLRMDKDPRGAAENWKAVGQFLSQLH